MAGSVCPRCHAQLAIRLAPGETCPDCRSASAWQRYGQNKLVIDDRALDAATQRRAGEAARESPFQKARHFLPTVVALLAGLGGALVLFELLQPAALAPLAVVLEKYGALARRAALLGFVGVGAGVTAMILLRRGRHFRSWPLVAANLVAVLAGAAALIVGGLHWWLASGGFRDIHGDPWEHTSMPALEAVAAPSPLARAVMDATTVILASDREGDMRGMAVGSGAVISRSPSRAWVLTNSHVAMPYRAVGSFRDPEDALPVLVYFSDGRHAEGKVVWVSGPPIDAVVLSVPIAKAPAPVRISPDAEHMTEGAATFFVPNPLRHGWRSLTGRVTRRVEKHSAWAGISLIYNDLPVEPGDSGSGLFDGRGRLIGINTWAQFDEDRIAKRIRPKGISLPSRALQEIMHLVQSDTLEKLDSGR